MLEPDKIRATGERVSIFGLGEGSSGDFWGAPRILGDCARGLLIEFDRPARRSFDGGAGGNLKFCENDPDAFLPVTPREGVLGAVETPGLLRLGRIGIENSGRGSCMVGGKEPLGTSGECPIAVRRFPTPIGGVLAYAFS